MKKRERLVAPVADYSLPYTDVFTLDLPFAPPPEVQGNLNNEQEAEMARITWKVRIEPGASVELGYTWHYFWR